MGQQCVHGNNKVRTGNSFRGNITSMLRRPPILLFDGECGLCNSSVRWVLQNETRPIVHFASLQSPVAVELVGEERARRTETVMYVLPDNIVLERSSAIIALLKDMGWAISSLILRGIPRPLRDGIYRLVARNRFRFQGKVACEIIRPHQRSRMLYEVTDLSNVSEI